MNDPLTKAKAESGLFQVDFQNLIKLLGQSLYTSPRVAVRELLQNASDSIVRRQTTANQFDPAIYVTTDRGKSLLIIEDNGAGMQKYDVIQRLASIGSTGTGEARLRLLTSDPKAANMLIGQFGIGFLSAFIIAEKAVVDTLSVEGGIPICWECKGTAVYQLSQGERDTSGTRVALHLKAAHYDLLEEELLRETIVKYADFIPFPIFLNSSPLPVNRIQVPWHMEAAESEYAEYIKHRYGVAPLALQPIMHESEDLSVQGVLFIPPRSSDWKHRKRSIDLFQKRMYVCEDLNLLPEWAGFVSGVLDCSTLNLVASREASMENPAYKALQDYLETAVILFVLRLAEEERPTFLEIIHQHDWAVKWGAVREDLFFEQVRDLIPFRTDRGPMVLPKYLAQVPERIGSNKTIFYVPEEQPLGQQQSILFRAMGIPIIQADLVEREFLKKYADEVQNVGLRQVASGLVELMKVAEGNRWRALEARFQDLGIVASAVSFYPPEIPAMAVRQADYEEERLIGSLMDGSRPLTDFISHVGQNRSDTYGICFNVDNPIIQRLAQYQGDETVFNTALRAIYSSAMLASGVDLTMELSKSVAYAQMRIIELLVEQQERLEAEGKAAPYEPSPFDESVVKETTTLPEEKDLFSDLSDIDRLLRKMEED
jgi:molecular chaperone HtpG